MSAQCSLNAPYDAKRIGDYTGMTWSDSLHTVPQPRQKPHLEVRFRRARMADRIATDSRLMFQAPAAGRQADGRCALDHQSSSHYSESD